MSRSPEARTQSSTHHLTPFTPDDGSEVQPMRVSRVVLAGQPRSCRPNLRGNGDPRYLCGNARLYPHHQTTSAQEKFTDLDESFKSFPYVASCRPGERNAESTVQPVVHRSVHPQTDPKPYGTHNLCAARRRIRTRAKHQPITLSA